MGTCPACHVHISDPVSVCPLCRHALIGDDIAGIRWKTAEGAGHVSPLAEEASGNTSCSMPQDEGNPAPAGTVAPAAGYAAYPNIPGEIRRYLVVFRVFLFVGICISAICIFVNVHTRHQLWWSAIVTAVTVYVLGLLWLFLWDAGYLRRIFFGILGAVGMFIVIDAVTGFRGWSVNYGFPGAVIVLDIVLAALMLFNRKRWESYLVFLILVILLGLVPNALMLFGVVTRPLVSEIALITAALVFLGALILGGQVSRRELHRRFHL